MFPLWLAIVIILFFVWLLIVETDKLFCYCDYVTIAHNTIVWMVNRKIIELCITRTRIY